MVRTNVSPQESVLSNLQSKSRAAFIDGNGRGDLKDVLECERNSIPLTTRRTLSALISTRILLVVRPIEDIIRVVTQVELKSFTSETG